MGVVGGDEAATLVAGVVAAGGSEDEGTFIV